MTNPVVQFAHSTDTPPIGRTKTLRTDASGNLVAQIEFLPEGMMPLADLVCE